MEDVTRKAYGLDTITELTENLCKGIMDLQEGITKAKFNTKTIPQIVKAVKSRAKSVIRCIGEIA